MALTETRRTTKVDGGAIPHRLSIPVAGGETLFQGGMVCVDANGNLNPAEDLAGLKRVCGVMRKEADNSEGSAGDINGEIDHGAFWFDNNGASVTAGDRFDLCYAISDEGVAILGTGDRPIAGTILDVDASLGVLVLIGAYFAVEPPP